jgi:toxin FitB
VRLREWLEERDEESLFLSVITFGELRKGIELIRSDARKRTKYEQALADLQGRFAGRILDIDRIVAETWGEMNGRARAGAGGPLPATDSLIAATAIVHRLVVVTSNVRHFRRTGVNVIDPLEKG